MFGALLFQNPSELNVNKNAHMLYDFCFKYMGKMSNIEPEVQPPVVYGKTLGKLLQAT